MVDLRYCDSIFEAPIRSSKLGNFECPTTQLEKLLYLAADYWTISHSKAFSLLFLEGFLSNYQRWLQFNLYHSWASPASFSDLQPVVTSL